MACTARWNPSHGIGRTHKQQVRVHLVKGDDKNHPERMFDVDDLLDLRLLDERSTSRVRIIGSTTPTSWCLPAAAEGLGKK